MYVIKLSNKLL